MDNYEKDAKSLLTEGLYKVSEKNKETPSKPGASNIMDRSQTFNEDMLSSVRNSKCKNNNRCSWTRKAFF